jgi:DNA polymerase III epsilon subunit-like protein
VVKPDKPVVSYLTALTGLTQEIIDSKGVSLPDAVQQLRSCLPRDAVLVGQNILQDVQWLGLKEGTDFKSCLDLAGGQVFLCVCVYVWVRMPEYIYWPLDDCSHVFVYE